MKLKMKKIGLLILILFFVGTIRAGGSSSEEQKFSDPFSDRGWGSESGGLREDGGYGEDNPNEDEYPIGYDGPVGAAPWLSLTLLGLTYGVYLFNKKRKEAANE